MPIQKILDLSTAHLSKTDRELLGFYRADGNRDGMALIAYPYEYGWTVSTSGMLDGEADRFDRIDAMRKEGFSEYFVAAMTHGADLGAVMLRFDADAAYEPGLPRFKDNSDEPIREKTSARAGEAAAAFHKTTFSIDVLSEYPLDASMDLAEIAHAIDEGDCVGGPLKREAVAVDAKRAAGLLREFGSEPGFFGLDDEGRAIDTDALPPSP